MTAAAGSTSKIRFVRCPQCRNILPEPDNVRVYACGGCGTKLQAKVRKSTDSVQTPALDDASEEKESISSSNGVVPHSSGECSSEQHNGSDQLVPGHCGNEERDAAKLPNEVKTNCPDPSEYGDHNEKLAGSVLSNESNENNGYKHESGDSNAEQLTDGNTSEEDEIDGNDQHESSPCGVEQPEVCDEAVPSTALVLLEHEGLSQAAGAECLPLKGAKTDRESKNVRDYNSRSSSTEKLVDTNGTRLLPTVITHTPAGESISSDVLVSSRNKQLELIGESDQRNFNRVASTDTFEATDFVNPSSELSGALIDLSKSPTTKSVQAYYDDGVSSYEGTDDQLPDRFKHPCKSAHKPSYYGAPEGRPSRESFLASSSSEVEHQPRNFMPFVPDKARYAMNSSKLDEDVLLEDTERPPNPVRNWRRLERDEYMSEQHPSFQRRFPTGYQGGSTSNPLENRFHYDSIFGSYDKTTAYTEQEKIKLLRLVYELQDQLKKTCSMNEKANGRMPARAAWEDQYSPIYEEENFHDYSGYPGRFIYGSNWPITEGKYSRIPFSAEATSGMHQVDHSRCCCSQDGHCSGQLPPLGPRRIKGYCNSGINCHGFYSSCPSSPQWHRDFESPIYCRGTKSDDQRHRENIARSYLRERRHTGKRHLRPIAGGAPFITCPRCSKQLQLPADFLLFKRRCHQIQCGVCSELLKFSLVNGIHLVPYTSTVKAPPPSEVDEYFEAVNGRNLVPVSRSDDCRLSTDGDSNPQTSSDHAVRNEKTADRREHLGFGSPKDHRYDTAGPSSTMFKSKKVSSEIEEEVPTRGGSPLHRLMGYSSPSDMIFGWGPSVSGTF